MSASGELLQTDLGVESAADGKTSDPASKRRGLWSFLTRTFVLGQLIVAEQFFGAAARANDETEALASSDGRSSSSEGAAGGASSSLQAAAGLDESGVSADANANQAKILPGTGPQSAGPDVPGSGDRGSDMSADAGTGQAAPADDAPLEQASLDEPGAIDPGAGPSEPGGHGPGPGTGTGPVLDPVIDLVDNVGGTVNDVLDTVGGGVGDLLDGLGETVADLGPAVLTPVQQLVEGLPILGDPLADVTGKLEPLVSNTLGNVAEVFPALGDAVGSGVVPVLKSVVSTVTNPDTLFDGGKYSDFNVTLQTAGESVTGTVTTVGSATSTLLDDATDILDLPNGSPLGAVATALNDPLKGGLGDLFS